MPTSTHLRRDPWYRLPVDRLTQTAAATVAGRVLSAVKQEYPNKIAHALSTDADVAPPRSLTPAFFGCFDWHSAVHGHWTLARLCRRFPDAPFVGPARSALSSSLSPEKLDGELRYLSHPDRVGFEMPYGIGWLLTLHRELSQWGDADAARWCTLLGPIVELGAARLLRYLEGLPHPVRTGEHSQTAFGASLFLDWAQGKVRASAAARVRELYAADIRGALHLEPSGYDFLSPCLAEADVMRRVLTPPQFSTWLQQFLPNIPEGGDSSWLRPVTCPDRSDGKLVHLDGLNASRAWMLAGIADALAPGDARRPALLGAASTHRAAALDGLGSNDYVTTHWLGTFLVYLTTLGGT